MCILHQLGHHIFAIVCVLSLDPPFLTTGEKIWETCGIHWIGYCLLVTFFRVRTEKLAVSFKMRPKVRTSIIFSIKTVYSTLYRYLNLIRCVGGLIWKRKNQLWSHVHLLGAFCNVPGRKIQSHLFLAIPWYLTEGSVHQAFFISYLGCKLTLSLFYNRDMLLISDKKRKMLLFLVT